MNLLRGDRMDKTPKMVESKLSCTQTRSKQLPGACPECPGTSYTRTLPASSDTNTKPTLVIQEETNMLFVVDLSPVYADSDILSRS